MASLWGARLLLVIITRNECIYPTSYQCAIAPLTQIKTIPLVPRVQKAPRLGKDASGDLHCPGSVMTRAENPSPSPHCDLLTQSLPTVDHYWFTA